MAIFRVNHIPSVSSISPTKTSSPHFFPQLQNPNSSFNCRIRYLSPTSAPPQIPLRVSSLTTTVKSTATSSTLQEICKGHVPEHILQRAGEIGFVEPTDIQKESLPFLFSGRDCILHAQTGSGKTLAYLLLIFSVISVQKSAVQALIVVPTRELGIQVTKVARMLAANPSGLESEGRKYTVMALLDGGMLKRHKSWLKAEPPTIIVATMGSLCLMLEKQVFGLEALRVLVVDEVDFMFNSSKQIHSVKKLLTLYSKFSSRQTVFASASIPQHNRFVSDCIQQKWTKRDVVHVHVNAIDPMPSCLHHRVVICSKNERLQVLLTLLRIDGPKCAIIFASEQSEKSKKAGNAPSTTSLVDFLIASYGNDGSEISLLEEDMNFNARAAALSELRQRGNCLLVATDIAARGVDLPETTHIYNFDLPGSAVDYLHRAGRAGRKPFSKERCTVTNIVVSVERFVLQRFENELMFQCEELSL